MVDEPQATQAPTLDTLKAELSLAIASGDDTEVIRISKLVLKQKSDVEKAEATRLQAEAEALAGDREKLAKQIWKGVLTVVAPSELEAVKATGFTFKLDTEEVQFKSVALTVPTVKTRQGGGGSTGALKESTGLARHELIDKYATSQEKTAIQKAYDEAESRPDSARYSAEKPVIKRILVSNPNLIKK